jgi:hypothetical protein
MHWLRAIFDVENGNASGGHESSFQRFLEKTETPAMLTFRHNFGNSV